MPTTAAERRSAAAKGLLRRTGRAVKTASEIEKEKAEQAKKLAEKKRQMAQELRAKQRKVAAEKKEAAKQARAQAQAAAAQLMANTQIGACKMVAYPMPLCVYVAFLHAFVLATDYTCTCVCVFNIFQVGFRTAVATIQLRLWRHRLSKLCCPSCHCNTTIAHPFFVRKLPV